MRTSPTNSTQAFVNQLLIYTLGMICFSGTIGLATVWMRHQISLTANANRAYEARINEIERRLSETSTAIAGEQDPAVLLQRNTEWRLGLLPPSQAQVVHVTEDPVVHLVSKRNGGLFGDTAIAVSLPSSLRR